MFESSSNGKRDRDEEAMMGDGDDLESDLGEEKPKKKAQKKSTSGKKSPSKSSKKSRKKEALPDEEVTL